MNKSLQFLLAVLFLILFGILGYLGYQYFQGGKTQSTTPSNKLQPAVASPTPVPPSAEYSGKISCLPLKPGAEAEDETCTFGLLTADGKYYALFKVDPKVFTLNENDLVQITGSVNTTFPSENKVYDIDGAIDVVSIAKR